MKSPFSKNASKMAKTGVESSNLGSFELKGIIQQVDKTSNQSYTIMPEWYLLKKNKGR